MGVASNASNAISEHQADIGWITRQLLKLENRFADAHPPDIQVFL